MNMCIEEQAEHVVVPPRASLHAELNVRVERVKMDIGQDVEGIVGGKCGYCSIDIYGGFWIVLVALWEEGIGHGWGVGGEVGF